MNPFLMPLYGEDCAVKSLDGANGVDADGDSCYDVLPFGSGSSNADGSALNVITIPELTVPCSSYDEAMGSVKLQFCSSWRAYEENTDCDANGASPCSFEGCSCEVVDLGVQIVKPEDAVSHMPAKFVHCILLFFSLLRFYRNPLANQLLLW
jgi:hypothetical protein